MPPVPIPFPRASAPGERPRVSGGRMVNAILEQLGDGRVNTIRAPGLRRYFNSSAGNKHCRGMIAANAANLLVVYDGAVEEVVDNGTSRTVTARGPLAGTGLVTLAINNATTPQIACVAPGVGTFLLQSGAAPATYPDTDVQAPNSVCNLGGYFFFSYGSGLCRASGINTTDINTLDSVVIPGGLLRAVSFRNQLFLFGPSGATVWELDPNLNVGFPCSRVTFIENGLVGTNAVAGYEENFTQTLMWVAPDNIVYKLNGYNPVRISNHDIERQLQALPDKSTVRAFVFVSDGHPYFCLKSESFTWNYDLLTSTWQERTSYLRENWRCEQSVFMWGDWLLGDEKTGFVFRAGPKLYKEDTDPLVWQVTSATVQDFPARTHIARADFDFASGTGIAFGDPATSGDPTVLVEWSEDGGASWSTPVARKLGKQGEFDKRVYVNRCGRTGPYGRQWRLSVSDDVYIGLLGGTMQAADVAAF